jgi:hypothetical protein
MLSKILRFELLGTLLTTVALFCFVACSGPEQKPDKKTDDKKEEKEKDDEVDQGHNHEDGEVHDHDGDDVGEDGDDDDNGDDDNGDDDNGDDDNGDDDNGDDDDAAPTSTGAKVELLIELPEKYNTPDGMCLLPSGDVLVSVPNVNDEKDPPTILRVKPDNTYEVFIDPPMHPETGKAYPFGICVCPDTGDVYYADLQWFARKEPAWNSRVFRIPMTDNQPGEPVVVAEGMVVANAVVVKDGCLYVSDTTMEPETTPLVTGVFKIELGGGEPVKLAKPLIDDPHLIATIETLNPKVGFGADGLCFDKAGNLYVGNFADGTTHKIEFNEDGSPKVDPKTPTPIWAKADFMKSCDGLFYDAPRERILCADSLANAVQAIDLDGNVTTIAAESTFDGANGKMDQPCEVLMRGDDMIISNFDMPVDGGVNTEFETPNCLSIIKGAGASE